MLARSRFLYIRDTDQKRTSTRGEAFTVEVRERLKPPLPFRSTSRYEASFRYELALPPCAAYFLDLLAFFRLLSWLVVRSFRFVRQTHRVLYPHSNDIRHLRNFSCIRLFKNRTTRSSLPLPFHWDLSILERFGNEICGLNASVIFWSSYSNVHNYLSSSVYFYSVV